MIDQSQTTRHKAANERTEDLNEPANEKTEDANRPANGRIEDVNKPSNERTANNHYLIIQGWLSREPVESKSTFS